MDITTLDLDALTIDQINELQAKAIRIKQERVANAPAEIAKLVTQVNALVGDVKKSGDADLIAKCKTELSNLESFTRRNYSTQEKITLINQVITKEWQRQSSILAKLREITNNDKLQISSFKDQLATLADSRQVDVSAEGTAEAVNRWEWKAKSGS